MNRTTAAAVAILATLSLAGCGDISSGSVNRCAVSDDNSVIAFIDQSLSCPILVCDGKTIRRVAEQDGGHQFARLWISRDGHFIVVFYQRIWSTNYLQPSGELVVYEVTTGQKWTVTLDPADWGVPVEKVDNPYSPQDHTDVYTAYGPVVTLAMGTDGTNAQYIQWRPGKGFQRTPRPAGQAAILATPELDWPEGRWPVVALSPDGSNPRKTVWVTRNGQIVELCRENDVPATTALAVVMFPFHFWDPYWWKAAEGLTKAGEPAPQSEREREQSRLKKLVESELAKSAKVPSTRINAED